MSSDTKKTRKEFKEVFEHWKLSPALTTLEAEYRRLLRNYTGEVLDIFLWHYFTVVVLNSSSANQFLCRKLTDLFSSLVNVLSDIEPRALAEFLATCASHYTYRGTRNRSVRPLIGYLCAVFKGDIPLISLIPSALSGPFYSIDTIGNLKWRVFKVSLVYAMYRFIDRVINARIYLSTALARVLKITILVLCVSLALGLLCSRLYQ